MLAKTGVCGKPGEYLNFADKAAIHSHYGVGSPDELLPRIHALGSTENGVFGLKMSFSQPRFSRMLTAIGTSHGTDDAPMAAWERAFPNHRHVFLTRRNKLRLAVSWWKAIKSGEWHRERGEKPAQAELEGAYDVNAIKHLLADAIAREAGIAEMLSDAGIRPLTVTYEDLVLDPQRELDRVLSHLGLPAVPVSASNHQKLSDALSETWVARFRSDLQRGWTNIGW